MIQTVHKDLKNEGEQARDRLTRSKGSLCDSQKSGRQRHVAMGILICLSFVKHKLGTAKICRETLSVGNREFAPIKMEGTPVNP